jgi:multidrug efflux pump
MLGVTLFGIFLTPVFYYVIQWLSDRRQSRKQSDVAEVSSPDVLLNVLPELQEAD